MYQVVFTFSLFFALARAILANPSCWPDSPISHRRQILQDCLADKNVPTSLNYSSDWSSLIAPFNLRLQYTPIAVTIPITPQHVSDSVTCASAAGVKVQPRSGG